MTDIKSGTFKRVTNKPISQQPKNAWVTRNPKVRDADGKSDFINEDSRKKASAVLERRKL